MCEMVGRRDGRLPDRVPRALAEDLGHLPGGRAPRSRSAIPELLAQPRPDRDGRASWPPSCCAASWPPSWGSTRRRSASSSSRRAPRS
ncbi:MAG: hypothetical protein MZW92_20470 [Comamonadaceae bacterium]|nr:hypothetical protein [Comamonadaceae bacterium]